MVNANHQSLEVYMVPGEPIHGEFGALHADYILSFGAVLLLL